MRRDPLLLICALIVLAVAIAAGAKACTDQCTRSEMVCDPHTGWCSCPKDEQ